MNGNADCMGQAGEQEAQQTIRSAITGGILLYLYELTRAAPFAIDFVKKFL
ncbi:hypothetical protein F9C07_8132 [Aspergillus flavus]|uniref:Uncharacterized protein n=1 Tax=Aspergillus flavus (strain ATCC 200026 / FGSC A1120 / IAM 13836 / NRRL 3357 / JCM 12722 / SRRC 167) TaxID=332952 RepID=A0A7U2N199_ASPFN|nr:hypothetical protein F9C07_8132 [Aspergillus flavus]